MGLALSERKLINQAGGEIVIQIDLRQAPIELFPFGRGK